MENNTDFSQKLQQDLAMRQKVFDEQNPIWVQLKQTEKHLLEMAGKEIVFSSPVVSREGIGIFRKGTFNVIQGKFGVHKSRLAELFCSLLLQNSTCQTDFLGFEKDPEMVYSVGYLDTERNTDEELPATIQSIREKSGYTKIAPIPNFYANSIKKIERKERLEALAIWIGEIRKKDTNPLFVVLDVVTDCVESFNRDGESMLLYDFLGNLCDEHKVIFLLLIHENFGTEKARGHTGTEAANKASCVLQISFEKNGRGEETELIKLKFIKLRGAKKPMPIYVEYSDAVKGLVSPENQFIQDTLGERKIKLDIDLLKDQLETLLSQTATQKTLISKLKEFFPVSENTMKERLKEISDKKIPMYNQDGQVCFLKIKIEKGKPTTYYLEKETPELPLENSTE